MSPALTHFRPNPEVFLCIDLPQSLNSYPRPYRLAVWLLPCDPFLPPDAKGSVHCFSLRSDLHPLQLGVQRLPYGYFKMKTKNKVLANNLLYHFPVNVCEAVITSLVSVGELFVVDA